MHYDFGDSWIVSATLEKVVTDYVGKLPVVIKGKGAGIIEDCGGIYSLMNIRQAFIEKNEEYHEYAEWLGTEEIDLDTFDIDATNESLKEDIEVFRDIFESDN